jgi:serine/threonine protein kinase
MNIIRFQGETPAIYYEIDKDSSPLGEGGMGRVYQGYRFDTVHNYQSLVAIKCIKPELVSNPTVIQRAQREASVQLNHPNLIRMYGFFSGAEFSQYAGGYVPAYYVAMERLVGVNLDDILYKGVVTDSSGVVVPQAEELRQMYSQDKVSVALSIMQSVLSGVGYLHEAGYIHRDLDPSNIMLTQDGNMKVIDFGICRNLNSLSHSNTGLTQVGQFLGKYAYAAPELILGDIRAQGPQTDVYALGIMLAQLITGHLPVQGSDQVIMEAHLKGTLDFSDIPSKRLTKIIQKATAKEPSRRYSSTSEFRADLMAETYSAPSRSIHGNQHAVSPSNIPTAVIPISCAAGLILGIVLSFVL